MARGQGARAQMALAFESTYGTAPGSGFLKMPFVSSNLGGEQALIADDLLGYGRDLRDPTPDEIRADGDVVVPVDLRAFGVWLRMIFGDATTTDDTGVYTHVFESGLWSLPSSSIEVANPEVPHFAMNKGVKANSLSMSMARGGSQLNATVNLMAQGETPGSTTGAGTPTEYEIDRFGHFNGSIQMDGSDLASVVSAEFTYSNNLDRIETIRDDGLIDGLDPSKPECSVNLVMRFADQTMLTKATSGTPVALSLILERSASEKLTIAMPRVHLPRPKRPVDGPGGLQVTFAGLPAQATDGDPMVTATLINDVETY